MATAGGMEYFWLVRRAMEKYRWLSRTESEEVLAEAIYACFVAPFPLTYALALWAVRRAVFMHCSLQPRYPHIPLHLVRDRTWQVYQPELKESNVVSLDKFRRLKN